MQLEKIKVYGLFGEYNYEIALSPGNLTYLHAQNGMGKSMVIRLVCNILQGNFEEVRTSPFERIDLSFDNNTALIVENRNQELLVQIQRNEIEEEVSAEEVRRILPVTFIGPERMYLNDANGHLVPALPVYMTELANNIQQAQTDSVPHPVPKEGRKQVTDAELDTWFRDLEAKVEFIRQAGFAPELPSGFRFPPSRYEISQYRDDYLDLAFSLEDYVDRYYRFAESIVVFKDIVNTIYVDKSVQINEKGYLEARMDRSGTVIPLNKFSSGEKQILLLLYQLLFRCEPSSLVIIDEPEISLHVSWQQQLGKTMADVAKLRGLQLIIATHAPAIIHDDWDRAVELKDIKGAADENRSIQRQ
ncbi:MAG: AAA family ATPase [Candidatus Methanomethylophilus sp.]|nr:AAA family ATPase [Methanomethylophilus sp.]MDD3232760.1 AAA family ATPase [Methanomethylophilus sp.]MDD4221808.1 AAA family ATPase [Methanomethylophilus sp.]MDD4668604.1 AAA family ATPase [Methanomethylophilus sp.]